MHDVANLALAATQRLRGSRGALALSGPERASFERDLSRIEAALGGRAPSHGRSAVLDDPFAVPLETPADLQGTFNRAASPAPAPATTSAPTAPSPAKAPPRPTGTEVIGQRARSALEAVDFPSFVAGLIQGTFQAIVDATAQQVREYAKLVADISRSVDDFTRDNVSDNQARDHLFSKHARDLALVLPKPGEATQPRIEPRRGAEESPAWLSDYGLEGEELSPELVEGPLLAAARRDLAEDRMRTLATMVLMGINRIVVDDGQLRARLQFHARARESLTAEIAGQTSGQQMGIAGRQAGMQMGVSTMVSTVDVNAQSDVSIKADLVGEVAVRFRTETFDLQRFADSPAIALISRHAQTKTPAATPAGSAPGATGAAATPAPAPAPDRQPDRRPGQEGAPS